MEFKLFSDALVKNFETITEGVTRIFEAKVDKKFLWDLYLNSFPEGTNPIYSGGTGEHTVHDCNCCHHFLNYFGNVVVIKNGVKKTIWDFEYDDDCYSVVAKELDEYVKACDIKDVYLSEEKQIGKEFNFGTTPEKLGNKYYHFHIDLPDFAYENEKTIGTLRGQLRDRRNVFKRSLEEISSDAIDTVIDLIQSNSLYMGDKWLASLQELKKLQTEYNTLSDEVKELWTWEKSVDLTDAFAKIKNHSIGVLLESLTNGDDVVVAGNKYNAVCDPEHYKHPKAIATERMINEAEKTIQNLGLMDSLGRRFANASDINAGDLLFLNRTLDNRVKDAESVFGKLRKNAATTKKNPDNFDNVKEITPDEFLNIINDGANDIQVYLENKHIKNFASLIAPENRDAKAMYKWGNNFTWAYNGNIADSSMKEAVKFAGGSVDGDVRATLMWNFETESGYKGDDNSDLDLHCYERKDRYGSEHEIYFGNARNLSPNGGMLDVDIRTPVSDSRAKNGVAVENIIYKTKKTMKNGVYKFFVNQYEIRGSNKGFKFELEVNGNIYRFEYLKPLMNGADVSVVELIVNNGEITVNPLLPCSESNETKVVWNVKTNSFVPVTVICHSPNCWDENPNPGNKHLFFFLKDCINPDCPNGFFGEFLQEELYQKHRRVFEILGKEMAVAENPDQLSGLGFSLTRRNDVVVKADNKVYKIKF